MYKYIVIILVAAVFSVYAQNDLNNRFMLANSYEQAGEFAKAKVILEELYSVQPSNYQFFDALNRVYTQLKEYQASEQLILKRINLNPQDINLYGLLGKTYHMMGQDNKAFETWNKLIEISQDNPAAYRLAANYAIERRAFSFAIDVLKRGKEKTPDPLVFSYDLANLYSVTMNYPGAASEFISVLKQVPSEILNVKQRISLYTSRPEALKQTIAEFEKDQDNLEIKSILAWLYSENGNFSGAYKLYNEIDSEKGANGADIFSFAQYLYSRKEYKAASEIFSGLIDKYPGSPFINASKLGYAKSAEELIRRNSFITSGVWKPLRKTEAVSDPEIDKLINTYIDLAGKTVSNSDVTNEASFRAARLLNTFKMDPGKAEELYRNIADNFPVSLFAAESALEIAQIYLKKGNLEKTSEYLRKVQSLPRANEEQKNKAKLLSAMVYFYNKDLLQSGKMLAQVVNNLKDNSANDAIELSLILNTKMNDSLSLLTFAEAEFLCVQEKFAEAGEKYALIPAEKAGILLGAISELRKAEVELALNNNEKAISILEKITDENSGNIYADKALYLLGNIYEYALNDPSKAAGIYEKLLAKFPGSMYLDEAREHILNLKNKVS